MAIVIYGDIMPTLKLSLSKVGESASMYLHTASLIAMNQLLI